MKTSPWLTLGGKNLNKGNNLSNYVGIQRTGMEIQILINTLSPNGD